MKKITVLLLPAFLFFGLLVQSYGETSTTWGKLTPGEHAVGFQVMFRQDPSRPYKPKRDYQGNPIAGNRSQTDTN